MSLIDKNKLTLYRGDYDKIKEFSCRKTRTWSYLGQGIYLTDERRVAESYRDKGGAESSEVVLYKGPVANRCIALEKALDSYAFGRHIDTTGKRPVNWNIGSKERDKIINKFSSEFSVLVDEGKIKADYLHGFHINGSRDIQVIYKKEGIGYLTIFEFPRNIILANTIHVNNGCYDESLWGMIYDNNISLGTIYDTRDNFIRNNKGQPLVPMYGPSRNGISNVTADRLKKLLTPYGIIGLAYNGGIIVGGLGRHQAYCLWDEDFVNEHKVKRIR